MDEYTRNFFETLYSIIIGKKDFTLSDKYNLTKLIKNRANINLNCYNSDSSSDACDQEYIYIDNEKINEPILHFAVINKRKDIVEFLLMHGVNANYQDADDNSFSYKVLTNYYPEVTEEIATLFFEYNIIVSEIDHLFNALEYNLFHEEACNPINQKILDMPNFDINYLINDSITLFDHQIEIDGKSLLIVISEVLEYLQNNSHDENLLNYWKSLADFIIRRRANVNITYQDEVSGKIIKPIDNKIIKDLYEKYLQDISKAITDSTAIIPNISNIISSYIG